MSRTWLGKRLRQIRERIVQSGERLLSWDEVDDGGPGKCEHCGGGNIITHGCMNCGAPVCCVDCCRETTNSMLAESRREKKEDRNHNES